MALSKETLQNSLAVAQKTLSAWEKSLETRNAALPEKERVTNKKDPKWRKFNADCADIQARLDAIKVVEDRNAALLNRDAAAE
jgi:hypothetical protein